MAIEFAVSGDYIINNASVGTTSGVGQDGAGTATISGSRIFQSDDYIVVTAIGETVDGQLSGSSAITGMVVYDSFADYQAGIPKYTYVPQNPGQTATIQSDVSGLGDVYLRFNSSVLISSDPGAPSLNGTMITPENPTANGGTYAVDRDTNVDYDGDGIIDPGPLETGDSLFNAGAYAPICFGADTLIDTPAGPRRAGDLRAGDMVLTKDSGAQPIRWISTRSYSADALAALPAARPIRVSAGALGEGMPECDLLLSPQHRVLVRSKIAQRMFASDEVLVAVKQLLEVEGIDIAEDVATVDYVHFMFDKHEIVFANGTEAESLFAGAQAFAMIGDAARRELLTIFPELADTAIPEFARLTATGKEGRKLARRHARNGKPLVAAH